MLAHPEGLPNISIHAPREGSDAVPGTDAKMGTISIHAPREGSDSLVCSLLRRPLNFYPRSPRGERRGQCLECRLNYAKFLSTLPARGATGGYNNGQ